jgi:hypothetical protein
MGYDPSAFDDLLHGGGSAVPGAPSTTASGYQEARDAARPANTRSVRACCDCRVYLDQKFDFPKSALRQRHNSKSSAASTLKSGSEDKWGAEIMVDGAAKVIYVTTRLSGVNGTRDLSRAKTTPMTDADIAGYYPDIVAAIKRVWNAKPYRLDITDDHCTGSYRVEFNPIFVPSAAHYEITFYNEPFEPNGRSNVNISEGTANFNFGDSRSVKNSRQAKLEAHEYGHMLGLLDEYFELKDLDGDGDGLDLIEYQLNTTTRTGRVFQNASGRSFSGYDPSRFTYRWEADRGGMQYTWPAVTGLPAEGSADDRGMMGAMNESAATRRPYIITVVYAVIEVLRRNGRTVTAMTVHS